MTVFEVHETWKCHLLNTWTISQTVSDVKIHTSSHTLNNRAIAYFNSNKSLLFCETLFCYCATEFQPTTIYFAICLWQLCQGPKINMKNLNWRIVNGPFISVWLHNVPLGVLKTQCKHMMKKLALCEKNLWLSHPSFYVGCEIIWVDCLLKVMYIFRWDGQRCASFLWYFSFYK
jgi:hypothetical protein